MYQFIDTMEIVFEKGLLSTKALTKEDKQTFLNAIKDFLIYCDYMTHCGPEGSVYWLEKKEKFQKYKESIK